MFRLTTVEPADKAASFEFQESCDIGRGQNCHVRIPSPNVSRLQARIKRGNHGFELEHLGSSSPTLLNDEPVQGSERLADGDLIRIAKYAIRFEADEQTATELQGLVGIPAVVTRVKEPTDTPLRIVRTISAHYSMFEGAAAKSPDDELPKIIQAMSTINAVSKAIAHILDVDQLLLQIPSRLLDVFAGSRAAILVKERQKLVPRAVKRRRGNDKRELHISATILEHVCQKREAVISRDAREDTRFQHGESVVVSGIHAIMAAPLVWREELVGVLYLDADVLGAFSQFDLEILVGIADQCAAALGIAQLHNELMKRQRIEQDLKVAQNIQRSFLPQTMPTPAGYTFCASYKPAVKVGGDFYDFIPLANDRLAIAIGDIAGKGIGAALRMARVSRDIRFFTAIDPDPTRVLAEMNRSIIELGTDSLFVTMLYALLDLKSGELTVSNAGHMPPILRRRAHPRPEVLDPGPGLPLGIRPDEDFVARRIRLEPGSTIMLFTDGLTEAMSTTREMMGMERVLAAVGAGASDPKWVLERALIAMARHVGEAPEFDDTTIVCFGVDPDGAGHHSDEDTLHI